jgi:hypothetical protein
MQTVGLFPLTTARAEEKSRSASSRQVINSLELAGGGPCKGRVLSSYRPGRATQPPTRRPPAVWGRLCWSLPGLQAAADASCLSNQEQIQTWRRETAHQRRPANDYGRNFMGSRDTQKTTQTTALLFENEWWFFLNASANVKRKNIQGNKETPYFRLNNRSFVPLGREWVYIFISQNKLWVPSTQTC